MKHKKHVLWLFAIIAIIGCMFMACSGGSSNGYTCTCSDPCTIQDCSCPDCPGGPTLCTECGKYPCECCPDCEKDPCVCEDTIGIIFGHSNETIIIESDGITFSQWPNQKITFVVNGNFDYFYWYINGWWEEKTDSNEFFIWSDWWSTGTYTLTVVCWKGLPWEGGVPYSKELIFKITN